MRAVFDAFVLFGLALGAAAQAVPAPAPTQTLQVEQIVPGMKGYGFSDLGDGKGIQQFNVEVLGVLKKFAPRQDLILARVSGAGLENAGVIAGMSGSPIYVDGKLIGALAYGWPFSKEPICGITPIQNMLDIRHVPPAPPVPIGGASVSTKALVTAFTSGDFASHLDELVQPLRPAAQEGLTPLPLPVSFGGLTDGRLWRRVSETAGWMATPSGAGASPSGNSTLRPGSAVAAQLLTGDMDVSATGTVTWVEGNSVLAFGHPFLSMGPVSMPMAEADVLTVLPSLYRSVKFAASGPILGSISQDRSTGILGTFGTQAPMVPISVKLSSDQMPTQTFHFQAVHNSMLTPILSAIAIDNVLTTLEKRSGERTLVWKSSIHTPGRDVQWNSVFSGMAAREEAVSSLALLTNYLMANEFHDLTIEGLDVEITHSDRLQNARIVRVEAGKERVRPGDEIPIWVDLADFRGGNRRVVMNLKVPPDTPPGPLNVFVGDGFAATAYDLGLLPADPHSLDQVLDFLARIRPSNSLNLLAYRRAPGAVVVGETLPALPPSVMAILHDRGPSEAPTPELSYLRLQSESVEEPIPVSGSVRLTIDVSPRIW
ncbi:MAG TPA: SpoIVB peptidase S55 domain-containing protein [Thermoanaerobaculia bacterium]